MSNNITSVICLAGDQLATNALLFTILAIKIFVSTIALVLVSTIIIYRYRTIVYHRNFKIVMFFVHYLSVYALCLTNILPYSYSLIKFIIYQISIANDNRCNLVERIVEISDSTCLVIRIVSLFAVYLSAISVLTLVIERSISTFRFRTYETFGIRIAILLVLSAVCEHLI